LKKAACLVDNRADSLLGSNKQTADALGVSIDTVERDWDIARTRIGA
jgi:hypothetical protein